MAYYLASALRHSPCLAFWLELRLESTLNLRLITAIEALWLNRGALIHPIIHKT